MNSFLLLTGMPGCGKTTMIKKLVAELSKTSSNPKVSGFYTEEARNSENSRVGFDVVTLDGKRCPLAKVR
jgi:nucleoside-triphosphatase THEP1